MATRVLCDRCGREIKQGELMFSGMLPVFEKQEYLDYKTMHEKVLTSKISNEEKDICQVCVRSFLDWWEDKNKE